MKGYEVKGRNRQDSLGNTQHEDWNKYLRLFSLHIRADKHSLILEYDVVFIGKYRSSCGDFCRHIQDPRNGP